MSRFVVFYDTEYTTWEGAMQCGWSLPGQYKELVQIGAVRMNLDTLTEEDEFSILVKPRLNPVLSDYFIRLTGISNETVAEGGVDFSLAYQKFLAFINDHTASSYGADDAILRINQALSGLPEDFSSYNIAPWFSRYGEPYGITPSINSGALAATLGAPLASIQEHNAVHDARSICAAYRFLMERGATSPFTA